jgi:hypothetical protein
MTKRLRDVTKLIRSKNAGPFVLTLDVLFNDQRSFEGVVEAKVITPELIAGLYGVTATEVKVIPYPPANAIKVSFPRPVPSGDPKDYDVMGGQQYAPIVDLPVPI